MGSIDGRRWYVKHLELLDEVAVAKAEYHTSDNVFDACGVGEDFQYILRWAPSLALVHGKVLVDSDLTSPEQISAPDVQY
jgi:hypothetical protein